MFKLIPRRSLIIYINNNRVIRALRHYGQIDYIPTNALCGNVCRPK